MAPRILFSVFGSAGDLFPLLPVVDQLRQRGNEVRVATGRTAGLYLRVAGIPTLALGDGTEMRVLRDPLMSSSRFDGWASWRHTMLSYVLPTLAEDVARIEAMALDWRPDLVVAGSFATAARIAARNLNAPVLDISVYPQHHRLSTSDNVGGLAQPLRQSAVALLRPGVADDIPTAKWLWGSPADVLIHDRALLGPSFLDLDPVGFPAWNGVPTKPSEAAAAAQFLAEAGPVVIATLGSFMGQQAEPTWLAIVKAAQQLGMRLLLIGAPTRWAAETFADLPGVQAVGFLDLDEAFPRADALVHHGGIGTTMAGLRAGRPAVVLPQAFDNMFNARLLGSTGAGMHSSTVDLVRDLETMLALSSRERAVTVRDQLVSPVTAAAAVAVHCIQALDQTAAS